MENKEKEFFVFLVVLLSVLSLSLFSNRLENYKPEILSENPNVFDVGRILFIVIIGTVVLVVVKLLGLSLRVFVEAGSFAGCYYFFSPFFGEVVGVLSGILIILLRATPYLIFINLSSEIAIISFSLLFGSFLPWKTSLLLISVISVYDVVAVLLTKHMKFLWLGVKLKKIESPKWRETFAVFFPNGNSFSLLGSGDFALPALFTVSISKEFGFFGGLITIFFFSLSFFLLEKISKDAIKISEDTGIPGIPPISLGACLSALFLSCVF